MESDSSDLHSTLRHLTLRPCVALSNFETMHAGKSVTLLTGRGDEGGVEGGGGGGSCEWHSMVLEVMCVHDWQGRVCVEGEGAMGYGRARFVVVEKTRDAAEIL